jgi:FG-GAP-like repeat
MNAANVVALALALTLCGQAATTPVDRRDYSPAGSAFNVATGDFNGDGILDIISTGDNSPGSVSVLLGNGDGTFIAQPVVSPAGTYYPSALAVGDFNHDGKLDLVAAIELDTGFAVEMMLGNGDGSFQSPIIIMQTNGSINYLEAIDVNGDGNLDVMVSNGGLGVIAIAMGTGQGTFLTPIQLNYGAYFVTGDFNGDGKLDIAVSRELYGRTFSVLLGNGDGTFSTPIRQSANGAPFAAVDLNNDGKLDLVMNFDAQTYSVLLGNGDGTFQAPIPVSFKPPSGSDAAIPLLVDVNRDGKPDLVIRQQVTPGGTSDCCAVYVLLGNGDGSFGPARSFQAGPYFALAISPLIVAADFNGDGNPDLAMGGGILFGQGSVSVLLGDGKGGFHEQLARFSYGVATSPPPPASVAAGDFNRDGARDVAAVNPLTNQVAVLLGNGRGALGVARQYPTGLGPAAVAVADFNLDGKPDVVTANSVGNDVTVMLGNGDGTFQSPTHGAAGDAPAAIAVADFNHDGKPDVAVANFGSNDVTILLGNGDGTFGNSYSVGVGTGPNALAVGDFNRDGKLDLAVTNLTSQTVSILLGNGDGTFRSGASLPVIAAPYSIAIGDFNQDGKVDLAVPVAYQGGASAGAVNAVLVAQGNGDGTFQAWSQWNVAMGPSHIAIGDFNLDGHLDLVTANSINNDISVLFGNGDGTFRPALNLGADYFVSALAVADFNGDGKPDVVVANPADGRLTMMLNTTVLGR